MGERAPHAPRNACSDATVNLHLLFLRLKGLPEIHDNDIPRSIMMLGRLIPHPKSTNYDESDDHSPRPRKRLKREDTDETSDARSAPSSPTARDAQDQGYRDGDEPRQSSQTELESALPPIETDQQAIDEYEAYKAAHAQDGHGSNAKGRLSERKWIRGKNSIYVDAFNLALDTVLEEEKHLFDEPELALFDYWRNLSYEAQYL
jgi:fanconi-associated nuclease 1